MKTIFCVLLFSVLMYSMPLSAQMLEIPETPIDKVSLGFGTGLDFGGFGGTLIVYPHTNIGVFAGLGFALAGMGYNVGIKARLMPTDPYRKVRAHAMAMYGYNASIFIVDDKQYNKLFYNFSFGAGIDIFPKPNSKGFWSGTILIPIRKAEVQDYQNKLVNEYGIEFQTDLLPIAYSIGYHFLIK